MKKIITITAALCAVGLAMPAAAQDRYGNNGPHSYANGYSGVQARTDQLRQRLQFGVQRGSISRREAVHLRDGVRQLTRLERQYSRDGLSRYERRDLQGRIRQLQQQIHLAERNRDNRYDRSDWNDRDDRDNGEWRDGRGDRDDRYEGDRRVGDDRDRDY